MPAIAAPIPPEFAVTRTVPGAVWWPRSAAAVPASGPTFGTVVGTLLNDLVALAALGDAVHRPPYKAPPRAPVLYIKPRNTIAPPGSAVEVPADPGAFEIGATIGLVIGRIACRVGIDDALGHLAWITLVADLSLPHAAFYRPSVRFNARDGSCLIGFDAGPAVLPCADPDVVELEVFVDGSSLHRASPRGFVRNAARLLADVSEFMTLRPGDVLLLGVGNGAPRVQAGQSFRLEAAGFGALSGSVVHESQASADRARTTGRAAPPQGSRPPDPEAAP